jgi:hypothetical protein
MTPLQGLRAGVERAATLLDGAGTAISGLPERVVDAPRLAQTLHIVSGGAIGIDDLPWRVAIADATRAQQELQQSHLILLRYGRFTADAQVAARTLYHADLSIARAVEALSGTGLDIPAARRHLSVDLSGPHGLQTESFLDDTLRPVQLLPQALWTPTRLV